MNLYLYLNTLFIVYVELVVTRCEAVIAVPFESGIRLSMSNNDSS